MNSNIECTYYAKARHHVVRHLLNVPLKLKMKIREALKWTKNTYSSSWNAVGIAINITSGALHRNPGKYAKVLFYATQRFTWSLMAMQTIPKHRYAVSGGNVRIYRIWVASVKNLAVVPSRKPGLVGYSLKRTTRTEHNYNLRYLFDYSGGGTYLSMKPTD